VARGRNIGEAVLILVIAWFVFDAIMWMFGARGRVRSLSTPGSVQAELGDESAVAQWEAQERQRWASALGIAPGSVDFTVIEEHAKGGNGPDNWPRLGWPTPCGPSDDPQKHCDLPTLTAALSGAEYRPEDSPGGASSIGSTGAV
jgi:hypothetical protein